jgi:hypothetical protein
MKFGGSPFYQALKRIYRICEFGEMKLSLEMMQMNLNGRIQRDESCFLRAPLAVGKV